MSVHKSELIEGHKMLGREVEYNLRDRTGRTKKFVVGIVTGVKRGGPLTNIKTGEVSQSEMMRIKPNDGSRAIWTKPMSPCGKS